MTSKYIQYRVESFILLILFVVAMAATIQTGNVGWFMLGWFASGVGIFHLNRIKCPNCKNQIMRKKFRYFYLPRQFFPKKCDQCGFDLTNI
jgi:hypothetical protein